MTKVLIGIQARSGSKRLPGKCLEIIDDRTMIEHVMNAARYSANFLKNENIKVTVVLLIPRGDPIKDHFYGHAIMEGSGDESDVLSRYKMAYDTYDPDLVVRITGDCPLIPPPIITKHILSSIKFNLDYCSNSYDDLRSFPDGYDCEVMSRRAMEWLFEQADYDPYHKEHVTTLLKKIMPDGMKFGVVMGHTTDLSHLKLSVDTLEELQLVKENCLNLKKKLILADDYQMKIFRY